MRRPLCAFGARYPKDYTKGKKRHVRSVIAGRRKEGSMVNEGGDGSGDEYNPFDDATTSMMPKRIAGYENEACVWFPFSSLPRNCPPVENTSYDLFRLPG